MIRSKILDMGDLNRDPIFKANNLFNAHFGNDWPEVPLRRWEYCCAIAFSEVLFNPGIALDAGCGSSVFSRFLKKIGCDVWAVDPGINNSDSDGIHYRKQSMTNLGFEDDYFNYVFAMSSIEHVNAGRFSIKGIPFDTGDTAAMLELCRVLKPGGILVITTDFAQKYYAPPGLWPSGSHRVYDLESLHTRLIIPAIRNYQIRFFDNVWLGKKDWSDIRQLEPIGYDYTEVIITMKKI